MNALRKKLLIVCTNADLAGAPCHVRDLAFLMRQQGWEVNVAFGQLGPIKKQLEQTGIPTHLIASMRSKSRPSDMLGTHSITCFAISSVDNWQTLKLAYWYSPSGLSLKPPLLRFSLMRLIDAKKSSLVM